MIFGNMDQYARNASLGRFRGKHVDVMIVTDLAARGIVWACVCVCVCSCVCMCVSCFFFVVFMCVFVCGVSIPNACAHTRATTHLAYTHPPRVCEHIASQINCF